MTAGLLCRGERREQPWRRCAVELRAKGAMARSLTSGSQSRRGYAVIRRISLFPPHPRHSLWISRARMTPVEVATRHEHSPETETNQKFEGFKIPAPRDVRVCAA